MDDFLMILGGKVEALFFIFDPEPLIWVNY